MPNPAKHRPYVEDPNAGLTLTYGKRAIKNAINKIVGVRTKKGTVSTRRAAKKVERTNRKRG